MSLCRIAKSLIMQKSAWWCIILKSIIWSLLLILDNEFMFQGHKQFCIIAMKRPRDGYSFASYQNQKGLTWARTIRRKAPFAQVSWVPTYHSRKCHRNIAIFLSLNLVRFYWLFIGKSYLLVLYEIGYNLNFAFQIAIKLQI